MTDSLWAPRPLHALLALLALAVAASALPFAATSASPASAQQSATEEVIVVLDDGADPVAAARDMGVEVTHIYRHVFTGFAGRMTPAEVGAARLMQAVGDIAPDGQVRIENQIIPDGVSRTGIPKDPDDQHLAVPSPDADIAILDTGITNHPDLNVMGGHSCVTSDEEDWDDDNGHGTHVAGIAAAIDNNEDVVGVAPGARLWAVKVLDSQGGGSFSDVICGLDWIVENAAVIDVINLSLSGVGDKGNCNKPAFHKAICAVVNAGVPVVVAAGNQGTLANSRVPGSYPEVITVSAFADSDGEPGGDGPRTCFGTQDDTFLHFSNFGAAVDIAAPGDCILSLSLNGGLEEVSGTSEAAPHVAGAAAHFIAQFAADNNGVRPTSEQTRIWLQTEASRSQSEDGVKGDRDFEKDKKKNKKHKKKKGDKGNNQSGKKKSGKKHKNNKNKKKKKGGLREPVLWLEVLTAP